MANESVFQDLIGFLKSDREDLRNAATEATMGVTDRYATNYRVVSFLFQVLNCQYSSFFIGHH